MSDRQKQLVKAGWRYDPASGYYTAPDAPTDGTARQYNEAAAWRQYQADQAAASETQPGPATRAVDPRRQEPK